jgi:hypothetical protein
MRYTVFVLVFVKAFASVCALASPFASVKLSAHTFSRLEHTRPVEVEQHHTCSFRCSPPFLRVGAYSQKIGFKSQEVIAASVVVGQADPLAI